MVKTKAQSEEKEVQAVEPKAEEAQKEAQAEDSVVGKKVEALRDFVLKAKVSGLELVDVDDKNKIIRSRLLIEGQQLPLFVVLNDTVYSYIQVHLVSMTPEKTAKCLPYLNELNDRFSMLKYCVNSSGNLVLTCSVPSSDDGFEPALLIGLIDQLKLHLEEHYQAIMKRVWKE